MDCPVCNVQLVMSERQGIEIDYCPKCRGVWLDRGELDKILERSTPELAQFQPVRRDEGHHDGHHGRYKKKSFLFDLFD
jgi:uncharacterized protein